MSVTFGTILDKRRMKKKTGTYPVKFQLIVNSETFRYQTIFDLSIEDYNKLSAPRISEGLQKVRDDLKRLQSKAETFLKIISLLKLMNLKDILSGTIPCFHNGKEKQNQKQSFLNLTLLIFLYMKNDSEF